MAEAEDKRKTGVLLTVVVAALAVVVWLWIGGRSPEPRAAPAADAAPTPEPSRTPAVARVANPKRGDVNADGVIDKQDVEYLKSFLFDKGQAPLGPADVNGDDKVDSKDMFYLANYLFARGPAPVAGPSRTPVRK